MCVLIVYLNFVKVKVASPLKHKRKGQKKGLNVDMLSKLQKAVHIYDVQFPTYYSELWFLTLVKLLIWVL